MRLNQAMVELGVCVMNENVVSPPSFSSRFGSCNEKNAPLKVVVCGGAGFVGSHLCEALLKNGSEVVCVDNLSTGRMRNIRPLTEFPKFEFLRHDVTVPLDIPCNAVFNLASPASPVDYQSDPIQTTRTNVLGALNLLELAERYGARFFQASTSEVYGDPTVHPQPETYWGNVNPTGPRACYDEGKRCAESLCFDFARSRGLDVRVARIFNTYGPRMRADDGRVVSNFIVQALREDDITIYGDGSQTRSFCYVDDLVAGILRLVGRINPVAAPVNLGNPGEFTIRELAEQVIVMVGTGSRIIHLPFPQDDPRRRQPDISRARALLNWQPEVDLATGLTRTIEHFRRRLERPISYAPSTIENRVAP
jgi:UDP-glucuronate decarboxylase